jgi:hypothetical protein
MNLGYKVPQDKHRITNHLSVMHLIIMGYAHSNIAISNIAVNRNCSSYSFHLKPALRLAPNLIVCMYLSNS